MIHFPGSLDNKILEKFGGLEPNSLVNIINPGDAIDNVYKLSSYNSLDDMIDFFHLHKDGFNVFSLNIQSLNAKMDKLHILQQMLYEKDIELDAFCLQETWIGPNNDISLFKLHNYNLVSQNTNISRHGGLAIYLHKKYDFNIINIHNNSEIWEGQFIEIPASENNKPITLINIYKPPKENTSVNINTFTTEISPILQALTDSKPNIIISGDFNIDLLKINEKRFHCDFFDTMITNGLFPAITLPTRFSEHSCTLIDNIFSSEHACITSSGILLSEISDHLPCFASFNLNISYNMPTYRIYQRRWTESLMRQLYDDISAVNIYEKLKVIGNDFKDLSN